MGRARSVAAAAVCAIVGCAPPAPTPPPAPATPAVERREVSLNDGWISVEIRVPATPPGPKPVIIGPTPDAATLLAAGVVLVTYRVNWQRLAGLAERAPAPPARNTVGAWLLASPTAKTVGKGYFELIAHDAKQVIPRVVDHLVALPDVDPARIAVSGNSTDGFKALQAVMADPRLGVAAVTNTCGDYLTFLHLSTLAMKGEPLDLDATYEAWLRAEEPVRNPTRLVHAAVLMVNGSADRAVPAACVATTVEALERAYRRAGVPERFRHVLIEDAAHVVEQEARIEVLAWWYRWLLSQ